MWRATSIVEESQGSSLIAKADMERTCHPPNTYTHTLPDHSSGRHVLGRGAHEPPSQLRVKAAVSPSDEVQTVSQALVAPVSSGVGARRQALPT